MSRRPHADAVSMEPECFTRGEFCVAHRIGLSTYYCLRREGSGPDEIKIGRKVLITKESAARWRAARDAEAKEHAAQVPSLSCNS
jgi:hypothetical protein